MKQHEALLPPGEPLGGKKIVWVAIYPPGPKADEATSINPKKVTKPTSAASVANANECADKNEKEQAKNHAISQGCPSREASATASSSVQDLSSTVAPPKSTKPRMKPTSKWKPRNL